MDIIISYNTYRKHAEKYNIKDKTKNGKPITYNKLKHRIDDYLNKRKNKELTTIKNMLIAYMNDDIEHDELMSNFVKKNKISLIIYILFICF